MGQIRILKYFRRLNPKMKTIFLASLLIGLSLGAAVRKTSQESDETIEIRDEAKLARAAAFEKAVERLEPVPVQFDRSATAMPTVVPMPLRAITSVRNGDEPVPVPLAKIAKINGDVQFARAVPIPFARAPLVKMAKEDARNDTSDETIEIRDSEQTIEISREDDKIPVPV